MPDLRDDADASRDDEQRITELNKQVDVLEADQARIKQQVDTLGARVDQLTLDRDRVATKWIAATDPGTSSIDLSSPEMSVAHELVHVPGRGGARQTTS